MLEIGRALENLDAGTVPIKITRDSLIEMGLLVEVIKYFQCFVSCLLSD